MLALAVNAVGAMHHGNTNVIYIAVAITLAVCRFQSLYCINGGLLKQEYTSEGITIETCKPIEEKIDSYKKKKKNTTVAPLAQSHCRLFIIQLRLVIIRFAHNSKFQKYFK